jgi:hypothetical protein
MNFKTFKKYFFNCFLLIIPILVWDLIFTQKLPKNLQFDVFWKNIPLIIAYGENISRTIMFIFIVLMPLSIRTITQKNGLALYIVGTFIYFASWLMNIYFPNSIWSNGFLGFALSPASTPLIWLIGIGLIGDSLYFNIPYKRWVFMLISIIFLVFHNVHAYIIYLRTH